MQIEIDYKEKKWGDSITVINRKCRICHKPFAYKRGRYTDNPDNWVCWEDQFWLDHWFNKDKPDTVRVNGNHYYISTGFVKGMGGAHITIHFNDGRIVNTDNLWHQGDIPERWQKMGMEDNAMFGEVNR